MTNKRYFWLKLDRNFFKRHDIKIIESRQNGKDHILFYLKLLVESIDHEGELRFNDTVPYDAEMLATITNTNIDTVKQAIQLFTKLKMMEIFDDGTIYMNEVVKMIGTETASTQRSRKHRENKMLQCNNVQQNCNTEKEKELDKETDIKEKHKKEKNIYTEDFETFWGYYPERSDGHNKSGAFRNWKTRLKDYTPEQLINTAINYQAFCKAKEYTNTDYVYNASNFLGRNKHFMDYQQPKEIKQNATINKQKTAREHGSDVAKWQIEGIKESISEMDAFEDAGSVGS